MARSIATLGPLLAALVAAPHAARAADVESTSTPYPGIVYTVWVEAAIPARIHVVEIDLSSSEISVHATTESERGQTPSSYAGASGAQVVVNGDYFSPVDFAPAGLAMGSATVWPSSADDDVSGFFRFDRNGNRTHATISAPQEVVAAGDLPTGTQGVVGGRPMLVAGGFAENSFDCADFVAMPCERAPRTAAAISENGNTMWLVVVDGWQQGSTGMTAGELAAFLDARGAHDALLLDGGGSSVLYIAGEGGVASAPSDGVERVVANHLAVRHGALPAGQLVGFVRERDIFDESANIEGATVTLDDGTVDTTGADGLYNFPSVTPRLACATASASGYHSETRCKQVVSGETAFNSIALYPNSDFVDAAPGAPDAAPADAAIASDGPPAGDGGNAAGDAGTGDPGGGCRVGPGGDTRGMPLAVFVCWLFLWLAYFRR